MPPRKLQISNPQPYTPPSNTAGPLPAALQPVHVPPNLRRPSANNNAHAHAHPRARFEAAIPPPGVDRDGKTGDLTARERSSTEGGAPPPLRPARSARRAPTTNTTNANADPGTSRIPSGTQQTVTLVQTSFPRPSTTNEDDPLSPIEPPTPIGPHAAGGGGAAAAWERDKSQRAALISASKPKPDPRAGERERKLAAGVVNAFAGAMTGAGKSRKDPGPSASQKEDLFAPGSGRDSGDVDAVLRKIKRDWPQVLNPDFAPTSLALSLLSAPSSDALQSFLQIHTTLSTSLSRSVRAHYQTYANSLPLHASLLASLADAQARIWDTRTGLRRGKELLAGGAAGLDAVGRRGEMAVLWNKERLLRDTLKLLDAIENITKVPERLESLIGDRKFLQAAVILTRSLKTIDREEMLEIEALHELRVYLQAQKTALMEILVDELSNHLYLKTAYSESRWVVYQPGQTDMIVPTYNAADDTADAFPAPTTPLNPPDKMTSRLSRFLANLSMKPMRDPILYLSDAELIDLPAIPYTRARQRGTTTGVTGAGVTVASGILAGGDGKHKVVNPEQDSFAYMEVILESLAVLGRLGTALEAVSARIGSELNSLIETTIDEVAERMDMRRADFQSMRLQTIIGRASIAPTASSIPSGPTQVSGKPARLRSELLDQSDSGDQAETLLDLFWTVYSKLRAVVEGHRVVSEIVGRIGMRPGQSGSQPVMAIPMEEVIKPMQKEVRTLMHDYLTDQDRGSDANSKPLTSINDVLRDSKLARDRHKVVFRFGDTDLPSLEKDLSTYQSEVDAAMKTYAPGLVTFAEKGVQNGITVTSINLDLTSRKQRQYRLLVKPNPFNARILFQPYLSFVSSAKKVAGISSLDDEAEVIGSFMDDFVVKVYLPQLEDKVSAIFQTAVTSSGAFLADIYWNTWSAHPVVKSATDVMSLVNSLCYMLSHTPFQQENYSRLIISIIVRYYQRCSTHYRDLVTSGSYLAGDLPLAATWAQRDEIVACLEALQNTQDTTSRQELLRQETRIELNMHSGKSVTEKDLIGGRAKMEALSQLYYSIRWLVSQLDRLKVVANDGTSPLAAKTTKRLSLIPTPASNTSPPLELSTAMAQRFDAILSTYDQLGDLVLFTIRAELRCRLMHYSEVSMSKGNYRIENEADEPDPYILDLTADLGECHAVVASNLPEEDVRFLFCGLGSLADQIMVSTGRYVRFATQFGVYKIHRNILAIQQTLRNITDGAEDAILDRAQRYWHLYELGPKAMLEELQNKKPEFSFDEYNHMLNLQCKVDPKASQRMSMHSSQAGANGSSSIPTAIDPDRTLYNDYLIDLHSLAMNDWD
ncbi:exocyst subunit, variant 2 [Naganishia albida]|nr:exocyst subunit, variant 2 [Naganishia albida]